MTQGLDVAHSTHHPSSGQWVLGISRVERKLRIDMVNVGTLVERSREVVRRRMDVCYVQKVQYKEWESKVFGSE